MFESLFVEIYSEIALSNIQAIDLLVNSGQLAVLVYAWRTFLEMCTAFAMAILTRER